MMVAGIVIMLAAGDHTYNGGGEINPCQYLFNDERCVFDEFLYSRKVED